MKKEINAPVAIGVAVVAVIALFIGLYMKFLHEPTVDPKVIGESTAGISRTQERLRQAGITGPGGPPNAPPNTRPGAVPR